MKVTAITEQVKIKGRYSIYVDEKFAFGISESGLIDSGIHIGLELDETKLAELSQAAETDKQYSMVLSLIARRPRSIWEVQTYLQRKKLDDPTIKLITERLKDKQLIDDMDFAQRWVENRRLLKPTSYRKLRLELLQKHVPSGVVDRVLAEDNTTELDVLKQEVSRKRKLNRYQDDTKLMQYLARQGYAYDDIKHALSENTG